MPKPPKNPVFEKNNLYQFRRGFASKIPADMARERFGLDPKESVVWLSPDGKRILSDTEAKRNNSRRRAALTLSDSWNDLKALDPEKAKNIGWNGFQKLNRGVKGSRIEVLQRLQQIGLEIEDVQQLSRASEGDSGENNGWGDSG